MNKIKIIAEIGINHNGDINQALSLIKAASSSGVWGVKFQYRNLDNAYAADAKQIGDEILSEEIRRNYLSPKEILCLTESAKTMGLKVGISFFEVTDLDDFKENIHIFDFFKTPSVELLNEPLNNRLLNFGKPLFLSLGCHSEEEVDQALQQLSKENWLAMHCVSNYPVSLANAKLGYLKHMEKKWKRPFGYSSHDENWEVTLIAMSMGASVIERHITFDKNANGLDHTTSSTPEEFARMAMFAQNMPLIIAGNGDRTPNQGELLNLQNLGRSYYTNSPVNAGDLLTEDKLLLRSPRVGMGQVEAKFYINKPVIKNVKAGQVLSHSMFINPAPVTEEVIHFAKKHRLSLPVRLHDQKSIERKFPIGTFEFHLSFSEVLSDIDSKQYSDHNEYSIHLPDYINPTQLMDPFSNNINQAEDSLHILEKTVNFADMLQQRTGKPVPVVGSFSVVHTNISDFYDKYSHLLESFKTKEVIVLPQWLPPIAWYFGGSVRLDAFNQERDIDLILKHNLPICMDVCHLCLGETVYEFDAKAAIQKLSRLIKHVHIADAMGFDGEGLAFTEGDTKNIPTITESMHLNCMKVIEVWQGHLDEGAGFAKALNKLFELYHDRK